MSAETVGRIRTAGKLDRFKEAVFRQKPYYKAVLQEYLDTFAEAFNDFQIQGVAEGSGLSQINALAKIELFTPYRNDFVDLLMFIVDYSDESDSYDRLHEFLESILAFQYQPDHSSRGGDNGCDHIRFILYEMFLYLIAVLIKKKRYAIAARFIEDEYHFLDNSSGSEQYLRGGADSFQHYAATFDEKIRQEESIPRKSTGLLLLERATHPKIKFADLFQADILLWLRPFFPDCGSCHSWYPRMAPYSRKVRSLEIFERATSKNGFAAIQQLLKVNTGLQLANHLDAALKNERVIQTMRSAYFFQMRYLELLNIKDIRYSAGLG